MASSIVRRQTKRMSIEDCLISVDQRMTRLAVTSTETNRLPRFHGHDAATYHLASGGHRIRARLGASAGMALGLADDDIIAIATAAELLHNASLVHDDLQDKDNTRRGHESVWFRYGSDVAICTGDLLISAAFASIVSLSMSACLPEVVTLMHERVASAVRGQGADLSFKDRSLEDISVYDAIAAAKSGALLSLPLELAFLAAGRRDWCLKARQAADAFAIGYQITDDIDDANRDRSLNIISVLKALGMFDPIAVARRRAQDRLEEAGRLGRLLPNGSGAFLVDLCNQLLARLIDESEMTCARS